MPGSFGDWLSHAVEDVGNFITHDVPNFITHDIPQAAKDVGKFAGEVITDTTKSVGGGIKNILSPIIESPQPLIREVTSSFNTLVPTVAQGGKTLAEGFSSVTSSLQLPLTIGLGVAGVLLILLVMKR